MRQYDVYENPSRQSRKAVPLLIVLQHDRAWETASVIVSALVPLAKAKTMVTSQLYPRIALAGYGEFVMLTPNMAAMPRTALDALVGNVEHAHREIVAAIDMLFTGV